MKKIIYLFVITAVIASCSSEPKFVVKGNIEGSDSIMFLLQKREAGVIVTIDSAIAEKGKFTLTGKVDFPDMVQLVALNTRNRTSFYLENSEIEITGTLDSLFNAKIVGSATQDEYRLFVESNKVLSDKYTALVTEYQTARQNNDTETMTRIEKEAEVVSEDMLQNQKDFVKNNPVSYVTPSLLRSMSYEMEATDLETAIAALDSNVAKVPVIVELSDRVKVMKSVSIGQKAPDFVLSDVNDQPVALYSVVGKSKLLLIDFWASWCGPCRQENPNVVAVWKEYNKKGFDVFGVSLDRPDDKEGWMKAIEDDKLTWTHVSDLKYWDCAPAKMYAVNAIPANFLLDENGIIIARNLRGEDLANKVKELLAGN